MRVAVIGGGWAGIAAAVELVDRGAAVTLIEAGRRLGGRARQADTPEGDLDNGQHLLLGAYTDCLALMRRVGARPEEKLQRLPLRLQDNRGFCLALPRLPAPLNLAWGLLAARGAGAGEKLRTALWMQGLKQRRFRLDHETSVSAWLDAAGQTGALRRHLWEPLCLAALNTPPQRASAQVFAHVLRDSLGSAAPGATDLLFPRGTLSDLLPDPATTWLASRGATLHTSRRVRHLEPGPTGGWRVDTEHFDRVIVAVAPPHLPGLLGERAQALGPLPEQFEPIGTVYFRYPPQVGLPFPLLGLQGGLGQWLVDRGRGVLAVSLSAHGDWEALPDPELARALHAEIVALIGPRPLPPWQVVREKRATFACTPGLPRCPQATALPDLWLAGDHCWADYPATLEGAVRSGLAAARLCCAGTPAAS